MSLRVETRSDRAVAANLASLYVTARSLRGEPNCRHGWHRQTRRRGPSPRTGAYSTPGETASPPTSGRGTCPRMPRSLHQGPRQIPPDLEPASRPPGGAWTTRHRVPADPVSPPLSPPTTVGCLVAPVAQDA